MLNNGSFDDDALTPMMVVPVRAHLPVIGPSSGAFSEASHSQRGPRCSNDANFMVLGSLERMKTCAFPSGVPSITTLRVRLKTSALGTSG